MSTNKDKNPSHNANGIPTISKTIVPSTLWLLVMLNITIRKVFLSASMISLKCSK